MWFSLPLPRFFRIADQVLLFYIAINLYQRQIDFVLAVE
jgi:hypothetical protein